MGMKLTYTNSINDKKNTMGYMISVMVYLVNSLVLYVIPVYNTVYPYYTYIGAVLLLLEVIFVNRVVLEKKAILMVSVIILVTIVDVQFNSLPIGEFFPLVWFFINYYSFSQLKEEELYGTGFGLINFVIWAFLIVYSIIHRSQFIIMFSDESFEAAGILNPNLVGNGIANSFLLMNCWSWFRSMSRVRSIIMYGLTFLGIFVSNSRTAIVFLGLALLFYLVFRRKKAYYSVASIFAIIIVLMGIIFPFIIIALWKRLGWDAVFLGKRIFTGRERIWSTFFNYLHQNPTAILWGSGKLEQLSWHEKFNLHNSYLAFFAQYGIISSILFWGFLLSRIIKSTKTISYRKKRMKIFVNQRAMNYALLFVLVSLMFAYTETNYTYILSLIYPAFAFAIIDKMRRKSK